MDTLPPEILMLIFSFLDRDDCYFVRHVCQNFCNALPALAEEELSDQFCLFCGKSTEKAQLMYKLEKKLNVKYDFYDAMLTAICTGQIDTVYWLESLTQANETEFMLILNSCSFGNQLDLMEYFLDVYEFDGINNIQTIFMHLYEHLSEKKLSFFFNFTKRFHHELQKSGPIDFGTFKTTCDKQVAFFKSTNLFLYSDSYRDDYGRKWTSFSRQPL